jgi:hypothetical protein
MVLRADPYDRSTKGLAMAVVQKRRQVFALRLPYCCRSDESAEI